MNMNYNSKTNSYMFKYLLKYVGKYSVRAEIDKATGSFIIDDEFEDFYIPCSRNCVIKHTYEGDDILALCFYNTKGTATGVLKDLKKEKIETNDDLKNECIDGTIYFHSKDLSKVAKVVGARTKGKSISPFSKLHLDSTLKNGKYIIPKADLDRLYKNTQHMDKVEKMQFYRKYGTNFLELLDSKKKRKTTNKQRMKELGLNTNQFIHREGLWDKYCNYIQKNIN